MKSEQEIKEAIINHGDTIYRIAVLYLKNHHDAEDIHQEVFLKYALHNSSFDNYEHEKAWLLRVAINLCKDRLRNFFRRNVVSLDNINFEPAASKEESKHVLHTLLKLPDKYRIVIYMVYYEGYSVVETARLLKKNENTVYTWLRRGKEQLKAALGGDLFE